MTPILFVANSEKRYHYFSQIASVLEGRASVMRQELPLLKTLIRMWKKIPTDEQELQRIHKIRQRINYPIFARSPFLGRCYDAICLAAERARFHYYFEIFNQARLEKIVVWNGQKQPYLTVVKAAEAAGKRIVYMENGLLPKTTTADFHGVNGNNCLPREPQFYSQLSLNIDQQEGDIQLTVRQPSKHKSTHFESSVNVPSHYIFVPFQVPSDTQIVVHSPWIHSMEQFFEELLTVQKSLRKTLGDKAPYFVFKEHPSYKGDFSHLHNRDPHCIFANANNTQELIQNAQAVITINSTVGLESLLLGQKVITLGNAAYTVDGVVLQASNSTTLKNHVENVFSWQPDQSLRQQFIEFLKQSYCVEGSWEDNITDASEDHLLGMKNRLLECDDLAQRLAEYNNC